MCQLPGRLRTFRDLLVGIAGTVLVQASPTWAQGAGGDIFGNLTSLICRIGTSLSGPLALSVGFVVLAGGGIALAFGGRRSMSSIVWGLLGIAVALGAGTIMTAAFGRGACS